MVTYFTCTIKTGDTIEAVPSRFNWKLNSYLETFGPIPLLRRWLHLTWLNYVVTGKVKKHRVKHSVYSHSNNVLLKHCKKGTNRTIPGQTQWQGLNFDTVLQSSKWATKVISFKDKSLFFWHPLTLMEKRILLLLTKPHLLVKFCLQFVVFDANPH